MSAENTGTKIALWNGGRVFSDPNRYETFAAGVRKIDADILVVPEALNPEGRDVDPNFLSELGFIGVATVPYEDEGTHPSGEQWLRVFSKLDGFNPDEIRLGTRNALRLPLVIGGGAVDVFAGHNDDRTNALRVRMTEAFLNEHYNPTKPTAKVFDENWMHDNLRAVALRGITRPTYQPVEDLSVRSSLPSRLHEMTNDQPARMLKRSGFRDADPRARATNFLELVGGLAVPIAQLDHIMVNDGLEASNFTRHRLPGSDQHWPISATITPRTA